MIPAHARISVFNGACRPFEFTPHPIPTTLGPGEVLVEVSLATVCGSDLHTADGRRTEPTPCILGHEAVGRIVALGPGRNGFHPGDRVTWTLADSCGKCVPCAEWLLPQKCAHLFKYGHASLREGSGLNGCYASHLLLRPGTSIVRIPEALSDAIVAPANCALATMVAATDALPPCCHTAVIQGAGLLGLYGCALLKAKGVARVLVSDVDARRLEAVRAYGGEPASGSALAILPAASADLVIEAAGVASLVNEGIQLLRPGGHYTWVGMVHPDTRLEGITGESVLRKCLQIRGVHNYAPRHLEEGIRFLHRHATTYPWSQLVSPPLPLEQLGHAFELARSKAWPRVSILPAAPP